MIGEFSRKFGFWTLDFLGGGKIRKYYKYIKSTIEAGSSSENANSRYLSELLDHAVNTTDYYAKYYQYKSLEDFPIMDKNTFRENKEALRSHKYAGTKLHSMSTSGSTGTPFSIFQDWDKRKRVQAEIVYFGEICGYKIGDKNAFLRVWTLERNKNALNRWKQNMISLDVSSLDDVNLEHIRSVLKKEKKIKSMLAYAASLDMLSRYLDKKNDTPDMFSIEVIISGSGALEPSTREKLKKIFGCNIISRYSNQENGILA